jgi:hypothetical protein
VATPASRPKPFTLAPKSPPASWPKNAPNSCNASLGKSDKNAENLKWYFGFSAKIGSSGPDFHTYYMPRPKPCTLAPKSPQASTEAEVKNLFRQRKHFVSRAKQSVSTCETTCRNTSGEVGKSRCRDNYSRNVFFYLIFLRTFAHAISRLGDLSFGRLGIS